MIRVETVRLAGVALALVATAAPAGCGDQEVEGGATPEATLEAFYAGVADGDAEVCGLLLDPESPSFELLATEEGELSSGETDCETGIDGASEDQLALAGDAEIVALDAGPPSVDEPDPDTTARFTVTIGGHGRGVETLRVDSNGEPVESGGTWKVSGAYTLGTEPDTEADELEEQ